MGLDQQAKTTAVSVDDAAAVALPSDALADRVGILIQNRGPDSIFIGGSDVTADNGVELVAQGVFSEPDMGPRVALYAICDTGNAADVRVMELA